MDRSPRDCTPNLELVEAPGTAPYCYDYEPCNQNGVLNSCFFQAENVFNTCVEQAFLWTTFPRVKIPRLKIGDDNHPCDGQPVLNTPC